MAHRAPGLLHPPQRPLPNALPLRALLHLRRRLPLPGQGPARDGLALQGACKLAVRNGSSSRRAERGAVEGRDARPSAREGHEREDPQASELRERHRDGGAASSRWAGAPTRSTRSTPTTSPTGRSRASTSRTGRPSTRADVKRNALTGSRLRSDPRRRELRSGCRWQGPWTAIRRRRRPSPTAPVSRFGSKQRARILAIATGSQESVGGPAQAICDVRIDGRSGNLRQSSQASRQVTTHPERPQTGSREPS